MPSDIRILLAEDDEFDARLTLGVLAKVTEKASQLVRDGQEALDYLYRRGSFANSPPGQPSLIVLDLKMPRVDGFEVLTQIKADPALRSIPVVILTSSLMDTDLTRAYGLGANAYVAKPMNGGTFSTALSSLFRFWVNVNEPPPSALYETPGDSAIAPGTPSAIKLHSPITSEHMKPAYRIILAEDDPYDARIIRPFLHVSDEQILVVRNGQDALDYLCRRERFAEHSTPQPPLLLLDLKMPQVDGFEVLRQIKGNPALRVVPVVVLTNSPDHNDVARAYALGANGYVVKDMDFDRYSVALQELSRFWLDVNEPPAACVGRAHAETHGAPIHPVAQDSNRSAP